MEVEEEVIWMPHHDGDPPNIDTLYSWCAEGPRKMDISDEFEFCESRLLKNVLSSKVS